MRRPAIIIAGLFAAFGSAWCGGERSVDVLIVEHPASLVVYNKYQQRLTPDEERRLSPFIPMILVREHDVLGDGFTPCAAVEIDRDQYYLLKGEGGEFASHGNAGNTEVLRNVTLLGDTALLLKGKSLRFQPAGGRSEAALAGGTRVLRLFEQGARTYVRVLPGAGRFGWVTLPSSARATDWHPVEPPPSARTSPTEVFRRVQEVVDRVNGSLRRIYGAIAPETGGRKSPPSFRLSRSSRDIRCTLEPDALKEEYRGSMGALLPEFERVLGGTGLHAGISGGEILIPLQ